MNKNTVIGIAVIVVIFVAYAIISRPTEEQKEAIEKAKIEQRKNDSIARVQQALSDSVRLTQSIQQDSLKTFDNQNTQFVVNQDSINNLKSQEKYGLFSQSKDTAEQFFTVENNKMIITFTNKGGKVYSVQLKEYQTFDSLPLILFTNDKNSVFGIEFDANGKPITTNDLCFIPSSNGKLDATKDSVTFSLKLIANNYKYLEYQYIIPPDDYLIGFNINFVGLKNELSRNSYINMYWEQDIPSLEKGRKWETDYTTIFLRMANGDTEERGERKADDDYNTEGALQWIAYKQQFFSSILIAKNKDLNSPSVSLKKVEDFSSSIIRNFKSRVDFSLKHEDKESKQYAYYFGPNKFSILKEYKDAHGEDLDLEKIVPLGWGIFGWVNRFLIIPIFNWLGTFITSYGLIIFLLTLIIKIILFPFTYKSYMSSAKMKVLKPQVDEINKKYGPNKKLEAQQDTMKLYKSAGASPMGGCLPMLLQFPILIAMFRFFPASIELRQQSFLWAKDLSSYDSILNLPFSIPFYGDHVSLFCLLMAISMVFSTLLTQTQQPTNQSMPGMKVMMYMMPVMMLFWFNDYSSGLSYYYLLANIITILQTLIIRKFFVNEAKILAKMEENKKKPAKPKSGFMKRLEEMQKAQQTQQQQQRKK